MLSVPARSYSDSQVPRDFRRAWLPISETNMIRLLMDNSYTDHPYLIGPDGRKCRQLMEKHNVKIHFPDMNRYENGPKINHVMLFGKAKNVEDARREMRERLPIRVASCLLDVENPKEAVETAEVYIRLNDRPVTWRFADDNSSCVFKTEFRSADYLNETFSVCVNSQKRHSSTEKYQIWAPVLALISAYNEEISQKLLEYIYEKTGAMIYYSPPISNMRAPPFYFIQAPRVEGVVAGYNYLLGLTSMQMMFVVPYGYTSNPDDRSRWIDLYLVDVRFEMYRDENVDHDVKRAVLRFLEFCLPHAYAVRSEILGLRSTVQCTKYAYMDEFRSIITSDVFKNCKIFFPTSVSERDFQKSADAKPAEEVFAGFYQKGRIPSTLSIKEPQISSSSVRSLFNPSLSTACEFDLMRTLDLELEMNNFASFLKDTTLKTKTNYMQRFAEECAKVKARRASEDSNGSTSEALEVAKPPQFQNDDEMFAYYANRTSSLIPVGKYHVVNQGDALVIKAPKGAGSRNVSDAEAIKDRDVMLPLLRKLSVATNNNAIPVMDSSGNIIAEKDPEPPAPRRSFQRGGFIFTAGVPKMPPRTRAMEVVQEKPVALDVSDDTVEEANNNNNELPADKPPLPTERTYHFISPNPEAKRMRALKKASTSNASDTAEPDAPADNNSNAADDTYDRHAAVIQAHIASEQLDVVPEPEANPLDASSTSRVSDNIEPVDASDDKNNEVDGNFERHVAVFEELAASDDKNQTVNDKYNRHALAIKDRNTTLEKIKQAEDNYNRHAAVIKEHLSAQLGLPALLPNHDLSVLNSSSVNVLATVKSHDISDEQCKQTDDIDDTPVDVVKALLDAHRQTADTRNINVSNKASISSLLSIANDSISAEQPARESVVDSVADVVVNPNQSVPVSNSAIPECFSQHLENAHTRPDGPRLPLGSADGTRSTRNIRKKKQRLNSKASPEVALRPAVAPVPLNGVVSQHPMQRPNPVLPTNDRPHTTPQMNPKPNPTPQINAQPGMMPQINIQPHMLPQVNAQPGMMPHGNIQPSTMHQANLQPGMMPQVNVQPNVMPQVHVQPGMMPYGNPQPGMMHQANQQPGVYMYPPNSVQNIQYAYPGLPVFEMHPGDGCWEIKGLPPNIHLLPFNGVPQYVQPMPPPPVVQDGNNVAYYQMCTPNGNIAPNYGMQVNPVYPQQAPMMAPPLPPGTVYIQDPNMQYYNYGAPPQFFATPPVVPFVNQNGMPMPVEQYGTNAGELVDDVFGPEYLYDDPDTLFVIVNPSELPPMCAVLLEIGRFQYMDCLVYAFMIPMETYRFFKRIPVPGRVVVKGESHVIPYSITMPPKFAFDVQFIPYVEEREATYVPNTFPKPLISFPAPKSLQAAREFIAVTYGFDIDETFMQMNLADGTPTFYHINRGTHAENQWDIHPCYEGPVQQHQYGGMRVM
uniref:KH domain-containing protein n=1 Tax=Panagrellus redivivus TaxID=6233 RepID=A0A7E4V382_PANRE